MNKTINCLCGSHGILTSSFLFSKRCFYKQDLIVTFMVSPFDAVPSAFIQSELVNSQTITTLVDKQCFYQDSSNIICMLEEDLYFTNKKRAKKMGTYKSTYFAALRQANFYLLQHLAAAAIAAPNRVSRQLRSTRLPRLTRAASWIVAASPVDRGSRDSQGCRDWWGGSPPREWRQPASWIAAALIQNKVPQYRYFYMVPKKIALLTLPKKIILVPA